MPEGNLDAVDDAIQRLRAQHIRQIIEIAAVQPERERVFKRQVGIGGAPRHIGHDDERAICGMIRYHPSHERELLARAGCGNRKLGEVQAGFPRQSVRVEKLTGRISDHRRIEARVASTACGRRARTAVAGPDDPEAGEPPGVVRIHQQHEREEQRTRHRKMCSRTRPASAARPAGCRGRMTEPIRI